MLLLLKASRSGHPHDDSCIYVKMQSLQLPVEHLGADLAHGLVEGGEVGELVHRHLRHERPRRRPAPVVQLQAVEVPRRVPHRGAHLLQPLLLLHAQRRRVRLQIRCSDSQRQTAASVSHADASGSDSACYCYVSCDASASNEHESE